jgi:hypothetical protein
MGTRERGVGIGQEIGIQFSTEEGNSGSVSFPRVPTGPLETPGTHWYSRNRCMRNGRLVTTIDHNTQRLVVTYCGEAHAA